MASLLFLLPWELYILAHIPYKTTVLYIIKQYNIILIIPYHFTQDENTGLVLLFPGFKDLTCIARILGN